MNPLQSVDVETILSGRTDWVGQDAMARLAEHPLEAIDTEFPHYVGSVDGPEASPQPKDDHPIFYGCFDWHSAVHSHWCLLRQLRLFEDHPNEDDIVQHVETGFTPENVAQEVAYFEDNEGFEKPYGWAWLLQLAAELHRWDDERADEWAETLSPLESKIRSLAQSEFLTRTDPIRVGTHHNTAFALCCLLDYARTTGDSELQADVVETARECYGSDTDYPVEYEPMGWDFLSPALTEADLMRRVLEDGAFESWAEDFFPDMTDSPYDSLLAPAEIDAESESGVALHLVGLNVSKAWSLAGVADALEDHRLGRVFEESAAAHAERGVAQAFTEDYAGTHWLTSFVVYLLTRNEGGIAPA